MRQARKDGLPRVAVLAWRQGGEDGDVEVGWERNPAAAASFLDGATDPQDWLLVRRNRGAWTLERRGNNLRNEIAGQQHSFQAGQEVTVVARWSATELGLSVDGRPFASVPVAPGSAPTNLNPTGFQLGARTEGGEHLDGDVLWFAAGTGALSDEDARFLHGRRGTDPGPWTLPPEAKQSLAWSADRLRYHDATVSAGQPLQGLQASYYDNVNLAGRPKLRRTDPTVDFNWDQGSPFGPPVSDNFSVRWSGYLLVPATGEYTFTTTADDGVRLTIDDAFAIDRWAQLGTHSSQPLQLAAGAHRITLDYREFTWTAYVSLKWACPGCGIAPQVIPASALRPGWFNQTTTISPSGRMSFNHFADPAGGKSDYTLTRLLDGTDVITSYTHDEYGRVVTKTMPKGNAGRTIDAQGNLQGTPTSGYQTSWSYYGPSEAPPDACGVPDSTNQAQLLKAITIHGIAATTLVYDNAGRVRAKTNGAGTTCSTYNLDGRLASDTAPGEAQPTSYTYDPAGAQRTVSNTTSTLSYEYDEAGWLVRTVDSFGAESRTSYDAEGNAITRTASPTLISGGNPGYQTTLVYDEEGKLTGQTDPAGRVYGFGYDGRDRLRRTQYPNGTFSWADYDAGGRLTALANRHGTIPSPPPATAPADSLSAPLSDYSYRHDLEGKRISETRRGGSTDLTPLGGVLSDATRAAGASGDGRGPDSSFGFWPTTTNLVTNGGAETRSDAEEATAGWFKVAPNTLERSTVRARFGAASLKATVGGGETNVGHTPVTLTAAAHTFSAWVWVPSDFNGTAVRLRNEGFGAAVAVTASADMSKRDQWQRLSLTFTPSAGALSGSLVFRAEGASAGKVLFFDGVQAELGDLPTPYVETNGQQASRTFGRVEAPQALLGDQQGWVAARVRVGFSSTQAKGQSLLDWRTDATNRISVYYDASNSRWRLYRRTGTVTAPAVSFQAGEVLTLVAAWSGSSIKLSVNGQAFTTASSALPLLPNAPIVLGGRVSGESLRSEVLWLGLGKGTLTNADAAAIHAQGNTDPGQLPGTPSVIWPAVDGSVLVPGYGTTPETTRYGYDALGRLEHVQLPDGKQRDYRFDLDSNRTQIVEDGQSVALYEYDPAVTPGVDQLTKVIPSGQQAVPYSYNADGEVTGRGGDSLAWDGRGRHSGGSFGGVTVSYGFDAAGFRRQRTAGGQTTRYLLGGVFETNGAGTVLLTDVDGPAGDLANYQGIPTTLTPVSFRYYDGHGNLAASADLQGNRTGQTRYDPFGSPLETLPANTTVERFTGRWDKKHDTTSSLIEMGVRPYDPALGRFLAVDPVEGGSANNYDYCLQDPLNCYDLDGRSALVRMPCACAASQLMRGVRGGRGGATEGIYIIQGSRGSYVGQSGNIPARLDAWIRSGRFTRAEVSAAQRIQVRGGRTQREIAEQLKIDQLGGLGRLQNQRNPIGRKRLHLMPQGYTR